MKIVAIFIFLNVLVAPCFSQTVNTEILFSGRDTISGQVLISDTSSYLIRSITIIGNKKTKDNIAFREVAVKAGEQYSGRNLQLLLRLSQEQLMNTTMFLTVNISQYAGPDNTIDIVVRVAERAYIFPIPHFKVVDRNWNVWIDEHKASLARTTFGLKLMHNNTTGRNDRLNLWVIGGYSQQLEFKYNLPFVDRKMEKGFIVGATYGKKRELNFATDSNRQQFLTLPNFGHEFLRTEATFSYRRGSQMRFYLRSMFGFERIDSAFFKLNPRFFNGRTQASFFDITANYQYLNVDFIPFPLRGWYVDFSVTNRFSSSVPMFQVVGKMLGTWQFLPKTYINFQGAFAATFQKNKAFFNNRLMGYGSIWMQGLEHYVMDGTYGGMARATVRRQLGTLTFKGPDKWKAYSRIPFTFYFKTYGNIGYVHHPDPGNNFMNNRLLRTAGVGVEIASIYDFVMKIDYSFNQFGERGFFIHTSADF